MPEQYPGRRHRARLGCDRRAARGVGGVFVTTKPAGSGCRGGRLRWRHPPPPASVRARTISARRQEKDVS